MIYTERDSKIEGWQGGRSDFLALRSDHCSKSKARGRDEKDDATLTKPGPILETRSVYTERDSKIEGWQGGRSDFLALRSDHCSKSKARGRDEKDDAKLTKPGPIFETRSVYLLDLGACPILHQLKIEEALLRGTNANYCVINRGSPRAIVMGISGKAEAMLNLEKIRKEQVPVIKRFSGGGTVIVDEETLFVTFILEKSALPIQAFPEPIMRWSGELYARTWQIPQFQVIENDYAIGPLKCGGNAQYIQKERWLHHTSFLWDFQDENMEYLKQPEKQPKYRQNRRHLDFLCRLKDFVPSKEILIERLKDELQKRFEVKPVLLDEITWKPHRVSVEVVF